MADMETVVGHLNDCLEASRRDNTWVFVRKDIVADALVLLKEREAVEPIPPTDESDLWRCGYCHHQLFRCTHQRYCSYCGHAVKEHLNCSKNPNSSDWPEIVRCRDCKYSKRHKGSGHSGSENKFYFYECENGAGYHGPTWFCADGKRKKEG